MFQRRTIILAVCFGAGILSLVLRLVDLQIARSDELRKRGLYRINRLLQVPPTRGRIKDRQGRVIATDMPSFDLWLVPAKIRRMQRKYTGVSQISGFSVARMVRIARSRDAERELDLKLALRDLEADNPLVRKLSAIIFTERYKSAAERRRFLARSLLKAMLSRNAYSEEALSRPRPWLATIGIKAYLEIEQLKRMPGTRAIFAAVETRVGTRRVYHHARIMGHITGYVGRLSPGEYEQLRGRWQDGRRIPGTGVIMSHGHVFFSVLPDDNMQPVMTGSRPARQRSMEMEIIRLVERRHAGRIERYAGYFANEMVGRSGVEQYYNQRLRGRHGLRLLRLSRPDPNSPRRLVAVGTRGSAVNGRDLTLTIDLEVQKRVRETLLTAINGPQNSTQRHKYSGMLERLKSPDGLSWERHGRNDSFQAICVLMNPHNGRIYAMVSLPDYDPNRLHEDFPRLLKDPRKPLMNLAISGEYPPGSTMKPLIAIAALSDGKILPDTEFTCEGKLQLGKNTYVCMNRIHHGSINISDALMVSCNIFFYNTGRVLGARRIYQWAWDLGLGHRTGIDLAGERAGSLPYSAFTGRGWSTGNTYHLSIGQGPITVTPLQLAVATAAIANGGKIVRPHLLLDDPALDQPRAEISMDSASLDVVRRGMWKVVQGDFGPGRRGTARRGRIASMEYAGKTGSAQWRNDTHAWFSCYAPFDKPEVVCVVLIPAGGHGGSTCAPIARQILMDFFGIDDSDKQGDAVG